MLTLEPKFPSSWHAHALPKHEWLGDTAATVCTECAEEDSIFRSFDCVVEVDLQSFALGWSMTHACMAAAWRLNPAGLIIGKGGGDGIELNTPGHHLVGKSLQSLA